MDTQFKSHLDTTVIPVLSAPFACLHDCTDDAPDCAIIWRDPDNGTYQHMPICCETHVPAIVYAVHDVTILECVGYRTRGRWRQWVK